MLKKSYEYNPDVLSCLANLSNDEVFTSPSVANAMIDLIPAEYFSDPDRTFLDPVSKTGVFLREIAKRLIVGLADEIPDLQTRINHIFTKQLFGIAITGLTADLSRRTLYCSRHANGQYAICSLFENQQGNLFFQVAEHQWHNGKCRQCGAAQSVYQRDSHLENHAYGFIHLSIEQIREINPNFPMHFDVIIGNPPYQLSDGGAQASATPIYHHFIEQAKKLKPKHLIMIIPARWYTGGKGLDSFRDAMLSDKQIVELHDFPNSADCFSGVDIKGGVCYFLWRSGSEQDCKVVTHENNEITSQKIRSLKEKNLNIFIRYNQAVQILHKVSNLQEPSFSEIVSSAKPFGLRTFFKGKPKPYQDTFNNVTLYQNKGIGYIQKQDIPLNKQWIDCHKVIAPYAVGSGDSKTDWVKPIYAPPNSACTETYLVFGPFDNENICENVMSYINTRFFHFMLTLKKNTQHTTKKTYELVPQQDFSKPWTDEELYQKYQLTKDEIAYIESMVRPMDKD
ncbi:Eco57I restriction-modification methylase domain-containing protein [Volucribacter amazonae]|uniref:site-specific DNA-methyltransferase (adenine-specific) n=1 Tax=Volucribacter amazonae TaxID=256731 RepID=A0A9X4PCY7_9PAST|nr:Eco57I restriction-modification methylase domain-containing protein [Volucribacter amazonae]MDG6896002.1 restriction endonuclease [Volucribacter amazonae]